MVDWKISDKNIESIEKTLLPEGAHFSKDAIKVIRCWHSTDVAACPGSGKTTVLLAKLKFLADRMPFENGSGICVLSHTNVAVDEIRKKLFDYTDKLFNYPNYIGTIQSFIDKFVTKPYLRNTVGRSVQVVGNLTYAQHMMNRIHNNSKYNKLKFMIEKNLENSSQFSEQIDYVQALYIRDDGSLCVEKQKRALAGPKTDSSIQFQKLIEDLLKYEGVIRYQDAYSYARIAVDALSETHTNLFSSRFKYVFVDEYQDCDSTQRDLISVLFNSMKCTIIKMGDPDQAIYNSSGQKTSDWVPQKSYLPILASCRYSQEIADIICKLKKSENKIVTLANRTGVKPVLLVFDPKKIDRVIGEFIRVLDTNGFNDNNGIYKAIGAVKKEDSAGLRIGSYWPEFDGSLKKNSEYNYWGLLDEITKELLKGKLYRVEYFVRKLLCRIFHYLDIKNDISKREFTVTTIKKFLNDMYKDMYRQWIYDLTRLNNIDRVTIDNIMRQNINELLKHMNHDVDNIFNCLPESFLYKDSVVRQTEKYEKNIFIDPISGCRIKFDTIHGVKGETHDATLYLETDRQGASDLSRIIPYFGVGKLRDSNLVDYSRKLAYVGMSRPRKLLCVAMQAKTYIKSKDVFSSDWEIIDLRE